MPSPFPGIDPYIEGQKWSDFHAACIIAIRDRLLPRVRPRYAVEVEERVFVERAPDDAVMVLVPDVMINKVKQATLSAKSVSGTTVMEPVECYIAAPEQVRQTYLTITRGLDAQVITIIEVLSPTNKRPGATGFEQYAHKRQIILDSTTTLVELDFLRAGQRMPFIGDVPDTDFIAAVCRSNRRPRAEIYGWSLEDALPTLPIPLAGDDSDVQVDFQELFNDVYDRAGYDYRLDYTQKTKPALDKKRSRWSAEQIRKLTPPPN